MIEAMKKAQIVVLKEDYENVIKSLQRYGVIMIINNFDGTTSPSIELNEGLQQRVEKTIRFAKKYEPKKGLFGEYKEIEYDKFINVDSDVVDKINQIEVLQAKINSLTQANKDLQNEIDTLVAWSGLELKPSEIKNSKYTKMIIGYILPKLKDQLVDYFEKEELIYQILGLNKNGLAFFVSYYYEDDEKVNEKLQLFGFNEARLPDTDLSISDYIKTLEETKEKNIQDIYNSNHDLEELAKEIDDYRLLSDQILSQEALNNIYYQQTIQTAIIEGWVRADKTELLDTAVKKATDIYDIDYVEPQKNETVPTYTKNNKFVSQFEAITDMFSKPSSSEIDPNPVMSVWYWFLFGMMMGDAGYGLMMMIICLILRKAMHPKGNTRKLINIILYSSIPTIFWGILFGSYFGFNPQADWHLSWWWYWFNPMDDPIKMLLVSVAVGALHLISGLIIKMVRDIKDKNITGMLAKDLSWILILTGIGAFFLNSLIGIIMISIGALLIIFFNGASKKSIFGKAAFGLVGLYDVTAYMSDLLSYSRIMALAMSSAAVAMVMNTLAQMVGGSIVGMFFAALIFIAGHAFNLVLGLLSAYVHDSRLQYIEFFGKFYDGGGVDFKPLSIETKYINEIKK